MLKGNSFTQDDENERSERLDLLSNNIGDYAVELALPAAKLAWAEGASGAWEAARSASTIETGQSEEAFEEFNQAFDEALKYYSTAKEYLLSIIYELEKPDDFIVSYGFKHSPRTLRGLASAITTWSDNHEILKALVPPDPRIVPDAIVAQLVANRDSIKAMQRAARREYSEKIDANAEKRAIYNTDSKLLRFVFNLCKLTWNDDDSRLGLLGFVPSSEIWTPGQPEPPVPGGATYPDPVENLLAENITTPIIVNKVSWDVLAGANSYSVKKAEVDLGQVAPPMPEEYYAQDYIDNTPVGDNDIVPGKTYYYWVCGVDETGVEGEWAICSCDYV